MMMTTTTLQPWMNILRGEDDEDEDDEKKEAKDLEDKFEGHNITLPMMETHPFRC